MIVIVNSQSWKNARRDLGWSQFLLADQNVVAAFGTFNHKDVGRAVIGRVVAASEADFAVVINATNPVVVDSGFARCSVRTKIVVTVYIILVVSGARARPVEATLTRGAKGYSGTIVVAIGGAP